jgi:ABC-type glycerol-3-phosphate transport system permease component
LNAAVLLSILPLLAVFIVSHSRIQVGLMGAGVKG